MASESTAGCNDEVKIDLVEWTPPSRLTFNISHTQRLNRFRIHVDVNERAEVTVGVEEIINDGSVVRFAGEWGQERISRIANKTLDLVLVFGAGALALFRHS